MITHDLRQRRPKEGSVRNYWMAAVAVVVAIVATQFMSLVMGAEPIASSMLCAVIFSAWLGGFGPAMLAIALTLGAFHYYLAPPINTFFWKENFFSGSIGEVPRLILFSITSLVVSSVISGQRKAAEALRRSGDELHAAIEDQKRIEAALLQTEMYLSEAQRLSHTGSFGWNATRREIFWSDETFRIFQYDLAIRPTLELVVQRSHPDDRVAVQETIDDACSSAKDFDHEYRLLMRDGSTRYVHAVARAGKDAYGITTFVGAVTDVTAAKETEQKLRRSEDHLRLVIDTIPTLVWRASPRGNPDFLNQPALDYTGLTLAQAEQGWSHAFHPDDQKRMQEKWRAIRESGALGELEARIRRFDGEYRWFLLRAEPLRDQAGNIVNWYGSATDIEDRKRTEVALRDSERRYREIQNVLAHANRVATMGQLTASIAHEVNQPISAAVTNAQAALRWLRAQPPDLEEARQALGRIVENGDRADKIIGRIRAAIKKVPPRKDAVAINAAILEVVALTHVEAMKYGVRVRTQLADGLPPIEGDRVQLQQVVLNLILNAIEAMSGTKDGNRDLLLHAAKAEPVAVHVAVQDSGPGVLPAAMECIFDAFYTTKTSGLGMGLSICRSIIEAHGGRLWASANQPRGTVFQFMLPARPGGAS